MPEPIAMPSSWPAASELRFVGRKRALAELGGYLRRASSAPPASLLALAAQVDSEIPLRESEPAPERELCPGCSRCKRPTMRCGRVIGGRRA